MTKWEVKMAWSINYRHTQNNWLSSIQPYPSNIFTHPRLVLMCHVTEYSLAKLGISEWYSPIYKAPHVHLEWKYACIFVLWHYLFLKAHSGSIMSTNKYWCIFSCQMEAMVHLSCLSSWIWEKNRQQAVLQGSPILTLRQPITLQELVIMPPGRATLYMYT